MKTKRLVLLTITLVYLVGCSQEPAPATPDPTPISDERTAPSPTPGRTGISILADGVVQPAQPALSLAFETSGKVDSVHVQAGDRVQTGDLMARLDDTGAQAQVEQALLNVLRNELALADLSDEADPAALATARANLASAQAGLATLTTLPRGQQLLAARQNLDGAQEALQDLLDSPDPDQVQIAKANLAAVEVQVQSAQSAYDRVKWRSDVSMTAEAVNLQDATINYERALAEYNRAMAGASDAEMANARARVAQSQAELDTLEKGPDPEEMAAAVAQVEQAQVALDALLDGASAKELGTAEINVAQARLDLQSALRGLENVELVAPAAGTVTTVLVAPGAMVSGASPIITLLDTTQLETHTTNLSERDLVQIVPGQTAAVTLKAYPNQPIEATVVRIGAQAGVMVVGDAATFPVVLVLSDSELDIRPGMTGRVEIRSGE